MIDFMVKTSANSPDRKWKRMRLGQLDLLESDLEDVVFRNHELLCLERIGLIVDDIHLVKQAGVLDPMGYKKYPDLMFLTDRGDVGIVEVKRFGNRELRGRNVISQILDYGATLCSLDERAQAALFSQDLPDCTRLEDVAFKLVGDSNRARWVAQSYRNRLSQGQLHYIIVCDEAPEGLSGWIRSASRSDATDYQISVLEISPFQDKEFSEEIMWLSQPVARTETIHRTTVQVIRDDDNGQLSINVSSESPETIAERAESEAPSETSGQRKLRNALEQLSEEAGLSSDMVRMALSRAHHEALQTDWEKVFDQFVNPASNRVAFLRGRNKSGLLEGRYGINLAQPWRPSVFVGLYFSSYDHRVEPVGKGRGGDFSIILDVANDWGKRNGFWEAPEFMALCNRLIQEPNGWTISQGTNPWHPLMIHRPLADVLSSATCEVDIVSRWFSSAKEGLNMLVGGGELQALRDRLESEGQE
ncbi:hypothetical protein [Halomonas sp. BC04]|uniref:hypothetical protein n=1 Tax=Halomonas sp. BC04 TaxID=1403540 RepID=UPI0003ED5C9F|nr:hypothetical protein [Halomonas sp. BC04]EWG99940.1 hypothetical protein Q427_22290 [Halomonas sp. BC04]